MIRFVSLALIVGATPLQSHPHVFVDTGLHVVVDATGQATAIEVRWGYDALYSMLTFEDRGLDSDYDGVLSDDELAQLGGFDLNWVDGFEGDLYLTGPNGAIALGGPQGQGVRVQEGRIISSHIRPLITPIPADGLVIQAYDPTYYTAYNLDLGVTVGEGCTAKVVPADLNAAYSKVEELLFATPTDQADDAFPEVGAEFADTVTLSCAP